MHWHMHKSWGITHVMWKDKKLVLLICTHVFSTELLAIQFLVSIPLCDGDSWNYIITSSMYYKYTTHMSGVDVVDQLQASYSCQSRSHNWWHTVFEGEDVCSLFKSNAVLKDMCASNLPFGIQNIILWISSCKLYVTKRDCHAKLWSARFGLPRTKLYKIEMPMYIVFWNLMPLFL